MQEAKALAAGQARANRIGATIFGTVGIVAIAAVAIGVFVLIGRLTSDQKEVTQTTALQITECRERLASHILTLQAYEDGRHRFGSALTDVARSVRTTIELEMQEVAADLDLAVQKGWVSKSRLSLGGYACEADRVFDRFDRKLAEEQKGLQALEIARSEAEIDAAMTGVLENWKKQAVEHYVANGAGPRVDTFLLKDGSSIICSTTFRNGIKAVSCNR